MIQRFERQSLTDTYFSEGISVGDINGDGNNDVIYGPYWFQGPEFTLKHEIYLPVPQPMEKYADHFFSWVYDFDGDKAKDVFTVGFPGTPAHVYRNPGPKSKSKHWEKIQVIDWVSNESPQWTNLVGDERPELVCTRDSFFGFATVDWSKPWSPWTFHPISEKVAADRFGHGLGVGDVNGDGRMDILRATGWFEQPAKNPESQRWVEHKAKFTNAGGGAEMYAYDVDGDGDNDVITSLAAHDFGLAWYEHVLVGDEIQFREHLIMGQHPSENKYGVLFSELHSVNLVDMDGDGLKDIVTGKTYYSHHQKSPMWDAGAVVYWFKLVRGPQGVDWIPYRADDKAGIGRQVVVHDINQDGLQDIAVGGMLGAHVLMHQAKKTDIETWQAEQPKPYAGPPAPAPASSTRTGNPSVKGEGIKQSLVGAIEAESLVANVTGGAAKVQAMGGFSTDRWSGNQQMWWTGAKPGQLLTLDIQAPADVTALELVLTCAKNYGIIRVRLDDQVLSDSIELYRDKVVTTGVLSYPLPNVQAGKHTLSIEIVGTNAKAVPSYMVGIDYLRWRTKGDSLGLSTPLGQSSEQQAMADEIKPIGIDGLPLNLDFETGDLRDWKLEGLAFVGQPIEGDAIAKRRPDMRSRHQGKFWIGGFEVKADPPYGTLTSVPFKVSSRFASFWLGGGASIKTRVELYSFGESQPFYQASGSNREELSRVVVDLRRVQDKEMFIRLVDEGSDGWDHLNFDHFRFHEKAPGPLTAPAIELVLDQYPHSGLNAELAAAAMKVPKGFRVQVCAAEPDVQQPIAFAVDDRGRTWVAEAYEYPQRADGDHGRDRILIFEDRDGDGKFDSRKIFAEGLNLVSGLEIGFGGVWVGAAPYLLFIPDRDQDDVPDGEPIRLLDGWGYQDTHETLNAFMWGPDGWLYGCHGVFTHSRVGKPGTPDEQRIPMNAGVWRYHPVNNQFEVFSHGTSNPWGVDFNDVGDAFITACVIPHLFHMIQGGRYHRQGGQHFNPHTYNDIKTIAEHLHYLGATPHGGNGKSDEVGGGHAHAGAMIYQGGAWPKQYHQALFMNNIHGQRLNVDLLEPRGSGYVGKYSPDFLLTGDLASQILNLRYGPDGQVTMIDWYDMQACHNKEVAKHDRSNGRIYKISYGTTAPVTVDLSMRSDLELAELCLNANDWYVRHARRLLQERSSERKSIDKEAVERLASIATVHSDASRRLRAIWALHSINRIDSILLDRLSKDTSPYVRSWSVRLAFENDVHRADRELLWKQLASDDSPVVRLALTSALPRIPSSERWPWIEAITLNASDTYDHNLPLMVWYAVEPMADVDPDRALAWSLQAGTKIPLVREYMLRRIAGSGGKDAVSRLIAALRKAKSDELRRIFLTAIQTALAGQRSAAMPDGWNELYEQLSKSPDNDLKLQATTLGGLFGDRIAMESLRSVARDRDSAVERRVQALNALIAIKDQEIVPNLLAIIAPSKGPFSVTREQTEGTALQSAALRGLAQYDRPEIAKAIVEAYPQLSIEDRRTAIATLCSRAPGAIAMLEAIESKQIARTDLSADLVRQLDFLNNKELNELLGKVWGQVRTSSAEKVRLIHNYKQLISDASLQKPEESLGREVFAKTCQRCHVLYGIGQHVGPDLTGSNRANLDYLLENVVDPSAVMANEYRPSIVLTDSGQVISGIVRSENEKTVTIQTADAFVTIAKDEIEQRQLSEKSMMPDDQLNSFTPHEIRSLIAYLRTKEQVSMEKE